MGIGWLNGRSIVAKAFSLLTGNRVLSLLFVINIFFALNMNMATSLQALFIESLGADALEIGLVVSVQGLISTLLMIPSGLLTEKIGGRKMLLLSSVLSILSLFMYTLSNGWQELLPWSIIYGSVFSTFVVTRMSLIADHSSTETRATTYGIMNITWSISGLMGPLIAGLLVDKYGWSPLFYAASLCSFLSMIPALLIRECPEASRSRVGRVEPLLSFDSSTLRVILLASLIQFAMCTSMGVVNPVIPLYLTKVFKTSKTEVGLFLAIGVGLSTLLAQIPSGIASDRYGSRRVMLACALITPALYLLSPWIGHYLLLAVVYMLINASWSMTWPSSMAHIIDSVPPSKRSIAIAIRQTAIRLGFTLGPFIGGYLWHLYELGSVEPTFSFYISALSFALSLPAILLLNKKGIK